MRFKKIQNKLLFSNIILVLCVAVILGSVFFLYTSDVIQNRVLSTYRQLTESTSSQMDNLMGDMDSLSKDVLASRVLYSKNMLDYNDFLPSYVLYLNEYFFLEPSLAPDINAQGYYLSKNETITGLLNSVNGHNYRAKQIFMYDKHGKMYCAPFNVGMSEFQLRQDKVINTGWFNRIIERDATTYILPCITTDWYGQKPEYVFSFFRSFHNKRNNSEIAIVEVQQSYDKVDRIMQKSFGKQAIDAYLFDGEGRRVYPYLPQDDSKLEYINMVCDASNRKSTVSHLFNSWKGENETLVSAYSPVTGWTIVLSLDQTRISADSYQFRSRFMVLITLLLALGFILSYLVSRSITRPLKLLRHAIQNSSASDLPHQQELAILASTEEVSEMLKYVTKSSGFRTTVQKELEYMLDYLSLMKMRYEENLLYEIDIPESMMECQMPKLILQPLVENSINHGFMQKKPPWKIQISGCFSSDLWSISVSDDGCGISKEKLWEVEESVKLGSSPEGGDVTFGHVKGVGLTNLIIRLKLYFKESFTLYALEAMKIMAEDIGEAASIKSFEKLTGIIRHNLDLDFWSEIDGCYKMACGGESGSLENPHTIVLSTPCWLEAIVKNTEELVDRNKLKASWKKSLDFLDSTGWSNASPYLTVNDGHLPGFMLCGAAEYDTANICHIFERLRTIITPAGAFAEYYESYDSEGAGGYHGKAWGRLRPWETGINVESMLFALTGIRYDRSTHGIIVAPNLPNGWKFFKMEAIRCLGTIIDFEVVKEGDETKFNLTNKGGAAIKIVDSNIIELLPGGSYCKLNPSTIAVTLL